MSPKMVPRVTPVDGYREEDPVCNIVEDESG